MLLLLLCCEYVTIILRLDLSTAAVGSGPTSATVFKSVLPIGKLSSLVTSGNVSDVSLRGILPHH